MGVGAESMDCVTGGALHTSPGEKSEEDGLCWVLASGAVQGAPMLPGVLAGVPIVRFSMFGSSSGIWFIK